MHQNRIAVRGPNYTIFPVRRRVETLQGEACGLVEPVVVDFIQVNFSRGSVYVVLVGRIAGPVAPRRIDLNYYNLISRKIRLNDVHDLSRSIAAASQGTGDVLW